MRAIVLAMLLSVGASQAFAPNLNPVTWSLHLADAKASAGGRGEIALRLHAQIADGYHLYSLTTPKGGPIPTKLRFTPESGVSGFTVEQGKPEVRMDATFGINVETFTSSADFLLRAKLANAKTAPDQLQVLVRYQACSDVICLPPVERMLRLEPAK